MAVNAATYFSRDDPDRCQRYRPL